MDDVHNVGAFVCLREVIKKMRSQQTLMEHEPALPDPTYEFQFAIVVVTSTTAEGGHAGVGPFAAAKHAQKSLVETAGVLLTPSTFYLKALTVFSDRKCRSEYPRQRRCSVLG